MALRPPGTRNRTVVRVAVGSGVVMLLAAVVVFSLVFRRGDRPEEDVAVAYLEALYSGEVGDAYALTSPGLQALVFPQELGGLAEVLRDLTGPGVEIEVRGSERDLGCEPLTALVGYRADTAAGELIGIVTLVRIDDAWLVREASSRFPDLDEAALTPLHDRQAALSEQATARLSVRTDVATILAEGRCVA